MKTEIDPSTIEAALIKLGEATPRQIADETQLELSDVKRALNAMVKRTEVEREKSGPEYLYWLTRDARTPASKAPTAKPKAAAVAVQNLHTPGGPADLAEQLRQAHAERLAMSQTIIAVCCAIGRDPATTTTAELPQALRDYIDAQVEQHTAGLRTAIADIREAVGDVDNVPPAELARYIKIDRARAALNYEEGQRLMRDCCALTDELMAPGGLPCYPWHGLKAAALLIDAHHAHIGEQADEIMALKYQVEELQSRATAQARQHQAETGLLAEKNARLHDEIEHLRKQPVPVASIAADPEPDAYLVTRRARNSRGQPVAAHDATTRHKTLDAALRRARSAINSGYHDATVHTVKAQYRATRSAEIKPLTR